LAARKKLQEAQNDLAIAEDELATFLRQQEQQAEPEAAAEAAAAAASSDEDEAEPNEVRFVGCLAALPATLTGR
jgi:hypothetical protein